MCFLRSPSSRLCHPTSTPPNKIACVSHTSKMRITDFTISKRHKGREMWGRRVLEALVLDLSKKLAMFGLQKANRYNMEVKKQLNIGLKNRWRSVQFHCDIRSTMSQGLLFHQKRHRPNCIHLWMASC